MIKTYTDAENLIRKREIDLKYKLKSKYNLSVEQYYKLLDLCDYRCEICEKKVKGPFQHKGKKERACVDHDHKTGVVRGILCADCNWGLGLFQDNPELCFNAAQYLKGR